MGNKMCCEEVEQNKITIQVGHPEVSVVKQQIPTVPATNDLLINSRNSNLDHGQVRQQSGIHNSGVKQASMIKLQTVAQPTLPHTIQQNLQKFNPFHNEINSYTNAVKIGNKIYRGNLNQKGEPHGFGKMFYPNNTVLVGKFEDGVPHGQAHYVWPDGSFYQGNEQKGKANDTLATYTCPEYKYTGSIKNNKFQGQGTLQNMDNRFKYTGYFQNNKRTYGKQTWKQIQRRSLPLSSSQSQYDVEYIYEGNFDQNEELTGNGKLTGPQGFYKGQFKNGMKNGKGVFQYKSGLKYAGDYKDNIKQGYGIIYNKSGGISYEGQFHNGLPHGKGKAPGKDGKMHEVQWIQGLTSQLIENDQTPAKKLSY